MTEVPPDIAEYLASPDTLPEWVRFYRAYPTVTAAVQAVGNGESVAVFTSEHTAYGQQVILIDGKPVIEVVLYPNSQAREALVTAYLNHSDPETATAAILHALPHLLPEDIDLTGIDCVVEPGNGLAPASVSGAASPPPASTPGGTTTSSTPRRALPGAELALHRPQHRRRHRSRLHPPLPRPARRRLRAVR